MTYKKERKNKGSNKPLIMQILYVMVVLFVVNALYAKMEGSVLLAATFRCNQGIYKISE